MTEYIILIALSPYLNKGMLQCTDKELLWVTMIWGSVISILPSLLPFYPWSQDDSNIGEFILLYFITGCIKRKSLNKNKLLWILPGIVCIVCLALSAMVLHGVFPKYEMYFYQYNSVFVIAGASAIFMCFLNIYINNIKIKKSIRWIQETSLIVYLLHMHPLFKERYLEWGIFSFIDINNANTYVIQILLTVLIVFIFGTLLGRPICYVVNKLNKIMSELVSYIWKRRET